jgi:hypothetical protein
LTFIAFQVLRRRSTGSSDRKGWVRICKDNFAKKGDSDKDSVGDDKVSSSDSDYTEDVGHDTPDGFGFKMFDSVHHIFKTKLSLDTNSSKSSSESSLNESESESDDDFNPGLFGLLDNPGVVRFGCVDYPLAVTEYSDDEYLAVSEHNTAPDWIRVSYDDLNLDINTAWGSIANINSDCKILSRSLDDIQKICSDAYWSDVA